MTWLAPRTWVTSEIVTAAMMNQHVRDNDLALADRIQVVYKAADQTVNNSATLVNDTHLLFTVVAGETYVFDINLIVTAANAAADIQVGFTFPAGTMGFTEYGLDTAATTSIASARIVGVAGATSGVAAASLGITASSTNGLQIVGGYKCTTGGTVRLQWAQGAATAANTTVNQGSTLRAIRETV